MDRRNHAIAAIILLAATLATALIYMPATGGTLHFDDAASLAGLARITDASSALTFVTEGTAGILGRPLALASFVPQAYAWPHAPEVFLHTNILLHTLNGVLLAWVFYLLTLSRGSGSGHAALTGAVGGALWLLLPILASSSLLIVQRMTLLSASFVLIGFIGYLYSRRLLEHRPLLALTAMGTSLVVASLLGALTKENGALLPLFILVTEVALLQRPRSLSTTLWRGWFALFLIIPAALIAGYLAMRIQYSDGVQLMRGFNVTERLLTQAHVLWQYVHQAFVPNTAALGPFQDDQPLHRDLFRPLTLLAVGGWAAAIAAAWLLRRRTPLPLFAIGWFLVGHALESTTIPLELYFEHRNYLPLAGPVFALVVGALSIGGNYQVLSRAALGAYLLLLGGVLFSVTTLWGNPSLAAEMWAINKPQSARATQYLAQRLEIDGYRRASMRTLERYSEQQPNAHVAATQVLMLSCIREPDRDLTPMLQRLENELPRAPFQHGLVQALTVMHAAILQGDCENLDQDHVYQLAGILAENPAYRAHAVSHHNLHLLMARIGILRRDLDLTMQHAEKALERHYAISTLAIVVETLNSAGLASAATRFIEEAHHKAPRHPLRRLTWNQQLAALESRLAATRMDISTASDSTPPRSLP
jgi:protein O-mannosyl-transferase